MNVTLTTLGADIHGYNTHVPAPPGTPADHDDDDANPFAGLAKFSLTQAMSSMLALGLTLEQVVPMVTTNAAAMIGLLGEIGTLRVGSAADVAALADERGRFILSDNEKNQDVRDAQEFHCFQPREGFRSSFTRFSRRCVRQGQAQVRDRQSPARDRRLRRRVRSRE